jgi:hypothetical protein
MRETRLRGAAQTILMTIVILNLVPTRPVLVTAILVITLAFAATANAVCLLTYF